MAYIPGPGYRLHENAADGRLRFLNVTPEGGAWDLIPADFVKRRLEYERERTDSLNAWTGSHAGKTIIVMGAGPQLKRITPDLARHLADRDDIVIYGVNALPKYCKDIWGLDPSAALDAVIGADDMTHGIWKQWGWPESGMPMFCRRRPYGAYGITKASMPEPSGNAHDIFYRDSVTCAISLAIIGQATVTGSKDCAGPYASWPQTRILGISDAPIVLVGVEHNKQDHCYTDEPSFEWLRERYDFPDKQWDKLISKKRAHWLLAKHAAELGGRIYNSAPWSLIDEYPFCDFEKMLDIPEALRADVGVSMQWYPGHIWSYLAGMMGKERVS